MTRLRRQDGYALVTATIMLAIMLMVGLTVVALGDTQNKQAGEQRVRESSFALTEGLLFGQGFVLANNWPDEALKAFPSSCSQASAPVTAGAVRCPNRDTLATATSATKPAAAFTAVDFAADVTWITKVRDDYGALATDYVAASADGALTGAGGTCAAPCSWDFNKNDVLWVQAKAVVRGKTRNIVAMLRREKLAENIPQRGITAGAIATTNTGNSLLIDDTDSGVFVRCTPGNPTSNNTCAGYDGPQIKPVPPEQLPVESRDVPMMDAAQLARYKASATKRFDACPPQDADLSGSIVWVEGCVSEPSFANSLVTKPCDPPEPAPTGMSQNCINSIAQPGILIWHCGRSDWQGGQTFVGVIYMVNNSDGTCAPPLVTLGSNGTPKCTGRNEKRGDDAFFSSGGFGIWGSLSIDGPACAKIGSNGLQFKFDRRVFEAVSTYGAVGLLQTSWRELPAGQ
jgi:hypothetical protein